MDGQTSLFLQYHRFLHSLLCYRAGNKKVGKPYMYNARHVGFPKFGGRDVFMIVDIGGTVRQGVDDFIRGVYTKSSGIYCGYRAVLRSTIL